MTIMANASGALVYVRLLFVAHPIPPPQYDIVHTTGDGTMKGRKKPET